MKKFITTITALMLTVFLAFAFNGCRPGPDPDDPDDPDDPENNMPTEEGVYLGIIGFNQTLTVKNISLLDKSSYPGFKNFISDLDMYIGTGLYYADYNAIEKLKSYGEPPKLTNVALVTFTDGLDNVSTDNDKSINPLEYYTDIEYYSALNNMIENDSIHGKSISAYTIGIKGNDVDDYDLFYNNLNKLASSKENVYEASDMNEVLEYFAEIAESLNSKTITTKLKLQIPGGYNDGTKIRFTFDNVNSADNSSKYIECTYTRTSSGRTLENITYHGLKKGETVLNSVAKIGLYYEFEFGNLTFDDGNIVNLSDVSRLKLWKEISTGWQRDGEFIPENSSKVVEEKSSALIMLVLDCTSSLGNDFSNMKQGAIKFVETLLSSGGNSGEPETPEEPEEPETPEENSGGSVNGHEYVDLGLSVKWATCNVGASSPEGYGNYYAWGETTTKSSYTSDNSKTYGKSMSNISGNANYDAARANWGGNWRMPTYAEMRELIDRCTWTWTTQNGVKGYKVKGPNGNSIFLPAAGCRDGSSLNDAGSHGYYWSSTPHGSLSNRAYGLIFGSDSHYMSYYYRSLGQSVRPILE